MPFSFFLRSLALLVGDIAALYAGLFLTLFLRYGNRFPDSPLREHLAPFSIVFALWLVIFYVAGLYDVRRLRNTLEFVKTLWLALFVCALAAIAFFYLIPFFGIAPKTNLFIFLAMFAVLETFWRRAFNKLLARGAAPAAVLLVGVNPAMQAVSALLAENPQLGYRADAWAKPGAADLDSPRYFEGLLAAHPDALIVVIERALSDRPAFKHHLIRLLARGVEVRDLTSFYELLFRKVPLDDVEETWLLEHVADQKRFYDQLKRGLEFFFALALFITLLPLLVFIALLVKLTSRGPALIRQARVGSHNKVFTLYKFRSMVALAPDGQAETKGAQWAATRDARVTPFGKLIRTTHLDELPQLLNIIRGDLSFVGPRPERPEFVATLKETVPYYETRLLVKPGVTGWAQLHHRSDRNEGDVAEKLQYDLYYLKHRSLLLDLAIIVRTLKTLFVTPR